MEKLTRESLYSLERYATVRDEFRRRVLAHKQSRQIDVGPHARLCFEDRLTIQYQVQEMLRVERIFEPAGIEEELGAYNPLIPDGRNWKATFMLEYSDPGHRREALRALHGVEHRVYFRARPDERIFAVADEDLDRSTEEKTSAVHFLRFELTPEVIRQVKGGAALSFGIDHPRYRHEVELPESMRASLAGDLA
ncbi:MAG: DUF3501 family protein [Acidiferrobacteraceae bacterium]